MAKGNTYRIRIEGRNSQGRLVKVSKNEQTEILEELVKKTMTGFRRQSAERTQKTKTNDKFSRRFYNGLRISSNPSLYHLGGFANSLGANVGLSLAIAGKLVQIAKTGAKIGLDVAEAYSGETMQIQNIKNVMNAVTNPVQSLIESTYGMMLRGFQVNRENVGLEYYKSLTGNIISTKDKGKYK